MSELERNPTTFAYEAALVRAALQDDPHRPRYHFVPPANWMNDPNGLIQWRGRYHLFYQHNPYGPLWADMHWGHAVSDDLVHWHDRPIALAPTPGTCDEDGVFSGCAVNNNGVPTIFYTGVRGTDQLVCLSTADPTDEELVTWRKCPANPIIPEPPATLDLAGYHDPSVWRCEDGRWAMVHGAALAGVGGAALLYRSSDLVSWEYLGPLHSGDVTRRSPIWTGSFWECPQLFALGDKHVLLVSVAHEQTLHYATYTLGTFDGELFTPEREGVLDAGAMYAPQTMQDDRGRRLLWGWLREGRTKEAMAASGWNGVMSLPWVLSLHDDATLGIVPAPELETLRHQHVHLADTMVHSDVYQSLPTSGGACLELAAVFDCDCANHVGLAVRCSPDGMEQTRISYEPGSGRLAVDRGRSSIDETADGSINIATLALTPGEPLRLRVFLDCSVIEIFANERVALTTRVYPSRPDSLGLGFFCEGGPTCLRSLDVWSMRSIWAHSGAER